MSRTGYIGKPVACGLQMNGNLPEFAPGDYPRPISLKSLSKPPRWGLIILFSLQEGYGVHISLVAIAKLEWIPP
ncbi:MAG: hypothetical protein ACO37W_16030, partial [Prochlorotrichaceae cyanobacterium]